MSVRTTPSLVHLLGGLLALLAACDSSTGKSDDADGDGVSASEDCDDNDPSLGAKSEDGDCDGTTFEEDCDDASPSSPTRVDDGDCDGIPTSADCNDADDQMPLFDQDCDGVGTDIDCNDSDAGVPLNDADCDGVLTADDCDDDNALLGDSSQDADCDGATTAVDCDDADPGVGDITQDADCDSVRTTEDCDDANDAMPVGDEDCDGIPAEEDCSDFDAELGRYSEDRDCDGILDDHDCDPDDTTNAIDQRTDADCDGLPTSEDCDDHNADRPYIDDQDCDDVATHPAGGNMVRIAAGTFQMGWRGTETCDAMDSRAGYGWFDYSLRDTGADDLHTVTLTHDFYLGVTEFTEGEYEVIGGYATPGSLYPEEVSWNDAIGMLNIMSAMYGFTECYIYDSTDATYAPVADIYSCDGYRLPTEAEWEFAARCGDPYEWAGSDTPEDVSYYPGVDYPMGSAQEVGLLDPNACGLYDMSGNMHEVIHEWYDPDTYANHAAVDPLGPETGDPDSEFILMRGGSWSNDGYDRDECQTAIHRRAAWHSQSWASYTGFRVARTIKY